METIPPGIENQSTLNPLEEFEARPDFDTTKPISEQIDRAVEDGTITVEEALKIYKEYTLQLEGESTTDHMTKLLNRRGYEKRLAAAFESLYSRENNRADAPVAILLLRIDLDDLNRINQFGHSFGDAALMNLAEAIKVNVRANDIAARIGGDEFAVAIVLESNRLEADFTSTAAAIAQRFQENLGQNIPPVKTTKNGQEIPVKVSATVGYAMAAKKTPVSWQELDEAADQAATQRKEELKETGIRRS